MSRALGTGQVAGQLATHLETPAAWMARCESLDELVGVTLGAASTCWTEKTLRSAGEFDSRRASELVSALVAELRRRGAR